MSIPKGILQQYNQVFKKYRYQEAWRKGYYQGYEPNSFLEQRGGNLSLLDIKGDTTKQVKEKIRQLEMITKKGEQQLVQVGDTGYFAKTNIQEAIENVSQRNYESYLMHKALKDIDFKYTYKNKYGDYITKTRKRNMIDDDIMGVMGMTKGRIYSIEGYGIIGIKGAENDKEYKKWLYRQDKYILRTPQDIQRQRKDFVQRDKLSRKGQMHTLKLNITRALFTGPNRVVDFKDERADLLRKMLKNLNDVDTYYMFVTNRELFNFGYMYSARDVHALVEKFISAIDSFKAEKSKARIDAKLFNEDDEEYPTYLKFKNAIKAIYE